MNPNRLADPVVWGQVLGLSPLPQGPFSLLSMQETFPPRWLAPHNWAGQDCIDVDPQTRLSVIAHREEVHFITRKPWGTFQWELTPAAAHVIGAALQARSFEADHYRRFYALSKIQKETKTLPDPMAQIPGTPLEENPFDDESHGSPFVQSSEGSVRQLQEIRSLTPQVMVDLFGEEER